MHFECLRRLDEAMNMLEPSEKSACVKALRVAPKLANLQSNPMKFLQYDRFDSWAAARHRATYWATRLEMFGEDRAFRPLTLAKDGALTGEDVDFVHQGASYVPSFGCIWPQCGGERPKQKNQFRISRITRAYFLLRQHVVSENPLSASEGFKCTDCHGKWPKYHRLTLKGYCGKVAQPLLA